MMVTSALINMGLLVLFVVWQPNAHDMYVYYLGAALWGFSDAVWQTQVNGKSFYTPSFEFQSNGVKTLHPSESESAPSEEQSTGSRPND